MRDGLTIIWTSLSPDRCGRTVSLSFTLNLPLLYVDIFWYNIFFRLSLHETNQGWTRLALIIHRKPLVPPFLWDLNWMNGTCPNHAHELFSLMCVFVSTLLFQFAAYLACSSSLDHLPRKLWHHDPFASIFNNTWLNTWFAGPRTDSFRLFKLWSGWDLFKLAC